MHGENNLHMGAATCKLVHIYTRYECFPLYGIMALSKPQKGFPPFNNVDAGHTLYVIYSTVNEYFPPVKLFLYNQRLVTLKIWLMSEEVASVGSAVM